MAGPAGAQASPENYNVELGAMFWKPTPEIVIASGNLATDIDFVNQFSIENKRFREFRVVMKSGGKHKLRYSTVHFEYTGNATLSQPITFRGQTYNAGLPTDAEMKWTLMRFGYEWDALSTSRGFVGLVADLKYNKMHAQLSAPAPIGAQTFDRNVAVPAIGGIARGYAAQYLSFTGELTMLPKVEKSGFNTKFYDFDLYGTLHLGRNVGVQYGYRSVTVDYVVDDDRGNLKLKGRYFGGLIRF